MRHPQQRMQKSVENFRLTDRFVDGHEKSLNTFNGGHLSTAWVSPPPPKLTAVPIQLSGIGNCNIQPKGSFFTDIDIDINHLSTTVYIIKFSQMSI